MFPTSPVVAAEVEPEIPEAPSCRYFCIRPTNNEPYCCDDGSNVDRSREWGQGIASTIIRLQIWLIQQICMYLTELK